MLPDDRGEDVQPNTISQMLSIEVRWIVDIWNPILFCVSSEGWSGNLEERTNDGRFRVKAREPARTGIPENTHEHRLDLIVERVRGHHGGVAGRRDLLQKLPPGAPPFLLPPAD